MEFRYFNDKIWSFLHEATPVFVLLSIFHFTGKTLFFSRSKIKVNVFKVNVSRSIFSWSLNKKNIILRNISLPNINWEIVGCIYLLSVCNDGLFSWQWDDEFLKCFGYISFKNILIVLNVLRNFMKYVEIQCSLFASRSCKVLKICWREVRDRDWTLQMFKELTALVDIERSSSWEV